MLQIPENDLKRKLEAIKAKDPGDPDQEAAAGKEHDTVLVAAWKTLAGDAKQALDLFLSSFEAQFLSRLTEPALDVNTRQFIAGQLRAVHEIQAGIEHFLKFNPDDQDYEPQAQFGDPDAGPTLEVADRVVY